jgi:Bacteriophage HK97-gp10, putative tail-component
MFSYKIELSGPLFSKNRLLKDVIDGALEETADWALNRVKSLTPVRTGALRAGWSVVTDKSTITLENPVGYAQYVEKRFQIVATALPQVEKKFIESTEKLIKEKVQ